MDFLLLRSQQSKTTKDRDPLSKQIKGVHSNITLFDCWTQAHKCRLQPILQNTKVLLLKLLLVAAAAVAVVVAACCCCCIFG